MYIERLHLADFRNYQHADVALSPGLNLLLGANGQGKTNLLEAAFLAAGRNPPRFGGNSQLVRWGQDRACIEAAARVGGANPEIAVEIGPRGRRLSVNGKPARSLARSPLAAALFCPETLKLVKEGAHARRELADDLVERLRPAHGRVRSDYARVVRQRNKALQRRPAGQDLCAWDEQLSVLGAEIVASRVDLVRRIGPLVSEAYATLSGNTEPKVSAAYDSRLTCEDNSVEAIAKRISRMLEDRRADEHARGVTLVGPHGDDLVLTLDGHDLRASGSQGEQRTAALALVLAEAQILRDATGEEPVLLLDDVVSELDETRRGLLLAHVGGLGQALVTATAGQALGAVLDQANVIQIAGGRVVGG